MVKVEEEEEEEDENSPLKQLSPQMNEAGQRGGKEEAVEEEEEDWPRPISLTEETEHPTEGLLSFLTAQKAD